MTTMVVRHARQTDAPAIAQIHIDTWRQVYRGQISQSYLDSLDEEEWRKKWELSLASPERSKTLVVEAAGDARELIGFCTLIPSRDDDAGVTTGELSAIYVVATWWRRGVGQLLVREARRVARRRNYNELTLWVLETNERARTFYDRVGFSFDGSRKQETGLGEPLVELRYRMPLVEEAEL